MKLLIATHSQGKKREYAGLLDGLGLDLLTLTDLGIVEVVEESGTTYEENALLKGRAYAASTGLLTLADDSGLEVDALGGAPGVRSARYAGEQASDADRYQRLLANLGDVPDEQRTARFRCVIALVWPDGQERIVEGVCEGRITREPRGEHGFGYDPIFYLPELGRTMAELPAQVKNRVSHRARAAAAAREILMRFAGAAPPDS
jgi:XTP/dITP diphosphohydrolase